MKKQTAADYSFFAGIKMLKLKLEQARIILVLIFFCLLFASGISTASSFKVFQTRQPAQDLIPLIAPLYANQATLSARNNSLIVRAPQNIINEIEQLLSELDQPLRNLLIEVSSSLDGNDGYRQHDIEGRIKVGDNTLIKSRAAGHENPNASIRYGKNGSVIKTTHTRRSSTLNNPNNFKVRTTEGHWAFIQTGQQVPYVAKSDAYYPRQRSVEWADVTSGFEVYPTLNGEQVTLKVRPKNRSLSRTNPGHINSRSMDTVVSGRLGQWLYLGGATNQINEQSSGTNYATKRYSDLDMNYRIRVNIID